MCVAHLSTRLLVICILDLSLRKLSDLFWSVNTPLALVRDLLVVDFHLGCEQAYKTL